MRIYKNISKETQDLIGYGSIEAGATIKTEDEINNPNFELQHEAEKKEFKKEAK